MNPRVIAFGEILWDMLQSGAVLGGAPANFAYRIQSLGVPVVMVSRVGNDTLGIDALEFLSAAGMDTSLIQIDKQHHPTGTVQVSLDEGNARYEFATKVAYENIQITDAVNEVAKSVDAICYGTLAQRGEVSRNSLYSLLEMVPDTALKVVDINLRVDFTSEIVQTSLSHANILKLNSDEVEPVCSLLGLPPDLDYRTFAETLIEKFSLSHVLVTRGAEGVYGRNSNGEEVDLPGYRVKVADTIGAGDAFTAGFVWKKLEGESFRECCDFGNRLGAIVAESTGGMAPCSVKKAMSLQST